MEKNILLMTLVVYIMGTVIGIAGGFLVTMDYYCEPKEVDLEEKCEDAGYIPPRNYHQLSQ